MRDILESLDRGAERAEDALAVASGRLGDGMLGVGVKFALLDRLEDRIGTPEEARQRARDGHANREMLRAMAEEDLSELLEYARRTDHPLGGAWLSTTTAQSRLIDLALDALFSEPLAPEVLLPAQPETLPSGPLHGLLFSTFAHITHELYPLMVDAAAARPALPVIGVHLDWLAGARVRRAMRYDVAKDALREIDVRGDAYLTTAQVLGLALSREHQDHARAAATLADVPLTNPPAGAAALDDKVRTATIWRNAGLDTPAFLPLPRCRTTQAARDALVVFLGQHGQQVVLKPTDGTEGRGVGIFNVAFSAERAAAFRHLEQLLHAGPVLALEERGSLRYESANGRLRCVVRICVSWDGATARAESGYAQVAATPEGIASAGQGGRVLPLTGLWPHLCREGGRRFTPSTDDWHALLNTACAGATALAGALGAQMPALIGLDLLLDYDAGRLQPVLLEANPRPAGMARCCLLTADGPADEPGIAPRLWDIVQRMQR